MAEEDPVEVKGVLVGAMEEVMVVVVEVAVEGHGGSRANTTTTKESPSVTLTGEQVKQWEQWQKGKSYECLTSLDG